MNTDKASIQKSIEAHLRERLANAGHSISAKPTKAALEAQAHYLSGAMAALQAVFGENDRLTEYAPPTWVIDIMRGELVVKDRSLRKR